MLPRQVNDEDEVGKVRLTEFDKDFRVALCRNNKQFVRKKCVKGTYSQLPTKNLDITSRTEEISNPSATRTRSGAAETRERCVLNRTNLISMPKKISSKNIEN